MLHNSGALLNDFKRTVIILGVGRQRTSTKKGLDSQFALETITTIFSHGDNGYNNAGLTSIENQLSNALTSFNTASSLNQDM